IRAGRALAQEAARLAGGKVAALPVIPVPYVSRLAANERNERIAKFFGVTATEQLTNGFHIHVAVESPEEGITALDRIRIWLPPLLALSSNSPFWNGHDSGFASYRYQAWTRWPTTGPTEIFGNAQTYSAYRHALLNTKVPLDRGMLYFDARLSEHQPTIEIRVADVCLRAEHAAVIATLARALVRTTIRQRHQPPPQAPATVLHMWTWQASRYGVEGELVNPHNGQLVAASTTVEMLLDVVRPVLVEYEEEDDVVQVINHILGNGSGARTQRQAYNRRHNLD